MVDISPNFASIVLGINGVVTVLPGFISPIVVGALTYQNVSKRTALSLRDCVTDLLTCSCSIPLQQTVEQWQIVFGITAGMLFVTGVAYVVFGRSEVQPWNDAVECSAGPDRDEEEKSETNKCPEMRSVC